MEAEKITFIGKTTRLLEDGIEIRDKAILFFIEDTYLFSNGYTSVVNYKSLLWRYLDLDEREIAHVFDLDYSVYIKYLLEN